MKKALSIIIAVSLLLGAFNSTIAFAAEFFIDGPDEIYALGADMYQEIPYALKSESGALIEDVVFSLEDALDGVFVSPEGLLFLAGADISEGTSVTLNAECDGNNYEKNITFKTGVKALLDDASQVSSVCWGTLGATELKDRADGGKYVDPQSTKWLKTDEGAALGIFRCGKQRRFSFSVDIYASAETVSKGAMFLLAGVENNSGGWWERPEFCNVDTENSTFDVKSYDGTNLGTFDIGSWLEIRIIADSEEGYYDFYINDNEPVRLINSMKPGINSIAMYVAFDNVMLYTGDRASEDDFEVKTDVPSVVTRPAEGDVSEVALNAEVSILGKTKETYPVVWELKEEYEGVSLYENVLDISSDAPSVFWVNAFVPGLSEALEYCFMVLSEGEENLIVVQGETGFTIPLSGSITSAYTAKDVFGELVEADWTIAPENCGITVDENGVITINSTALSGKYTLTAVSGEKSGTFTFETELDNLTIKGDFEILLPDADAYLKFPYTLEDDEGNKYPAKFSLVPQTEGCFIDEDGVLRIQSGIFDLKSKLGIYAEYGDITAFEPLSFSAGYSEDFTSNYWTSSSYVKSENGNKYLSPDGTRCDSPTIMQGPGFTNVVLEFDFRPSETAKSFNVGGARTPGDSNLAKWWLEFKASKQNDTANISLNSGSSVIADSVSHKMNGDWMNVRMNISALTGAVELFVDDQPVSSGYLTDAFIDFHIKSIICYADIDNVKIYSGEMAKTEKFKIEITTPETIPAPSSERETVVPLTADVIDNQTIVRNHPVKWSVEPQSSKITVEDGKLFVKKGAPESFEIKATVSGVGVSESKSVELKTPDVELKLENGDVLISGRANDNITLTLYAPLDNSNMPAAFLASGDRVFDEAQSESMSVTLDSKGEYVLDMSAYAPGFYKLYAVADGTENYIEIIHMIDKVLSKTNADENISHESDFEDFLVKYGKADPESAQNAIDAYAELEDKAFATALSDCNPVWFVPSVMAAQISESIISSNSDCKEAAMSLEAMLGGIGFTTNSYTLLYKNSDLENVVKTVYQKAENGLDKYLELLRDHSILCGIRKLAHIDNGKVFLEQLGNKKYDEASASDKSYICAEVCNKSYSSVEELERAINNVDLPKKESGSTGGGGGGKSISSGSVPLAVAPGLPSLDSSASPQQRYHDLSGNHWAYEAVENLSNRGIINGYNGYFSPENNITRAEFIKILCTAFGITPGGEDAFEDVEPEDWFAPWINAAFASGLVEGSLGRVYPEDFISRQDAAVLLFRFSKYASMTFTQEQKEFSDSSLIAPYAKEAVGTLASGGFINGMGDGSFAPQAEMTRAQAAQLLYNITGGGMK